MTDSDVSSAITPLLPALREQAASTDASGEWPAEALALLARAGAHRWAVPGAFDGLDLDALSLHEAYRLVSTAAMSLALVCTQRDGALGLIEDSTNTPLRERLLTEAAEHDYLATVGIAQLTTSRQYGKPAVVAERASCGYRLSGRIPWSTGAAHARYVLTGAIVDGAPGDRSQILAAVRSDAPGVTVEPPMRLVAMTATHTTGIVLDGVEVSEADLVAGPGKGVLASRVRKVPIGQSFLALGHVRAAIDVIRQSPTPAAGRAADELERDAAEHEQRVRAFVTQDTPDGETGDRLRAGVIDLAQRAGQSAVAVHKGAALDLTHPAQRVAREALFLLVWSCPSGVLDCTLEHLLAGSA